jgi:hypothetical protein
MAKARPKAPDAGVKVNYVDPRLKIEKEWDAKFPEWKHVWKANDSELRNAQWVKDGEDRITNGMESLARLPKEAWLARQKQKSDATLDLMKTVRTNDDGSAFVSDPLVQYRNPKRVRNEE